MRNGKVTDFLGTSHMHPPNEKIRQEEISLPPQFMLGKTYSAIVWSNAAGSQGLAWVPLDARPLAL